MRCSALRCSGLNHQPRACSVHPSMTMERLGWPQRNATVTAGSGSISGNGGALAKCSRGCSLLAADETTSNLVSCKSVQLYAIVAVCHSLIQSSPGTGLPVILVTVCGYILSCLAAYICLLVVHTCFLPPIPMCKVHMSVR